MDTEINSQPRVNSARLGDFVGRIVRLVCKVERIKGNSAIVRASDHGQIEVTSTMPLEELLSGTFVEFIGSVEDSSTVKMQACIPLGTDLDMDLANDCINMTHDSRFQNIF
ncbi:hypothetical protein ACEPAI_9845 [Sanghuangporus weigelae]